MKNARKLVKVRGRVKTWIDENDRDRFMIVTADNERFKADTNRAGADLEDFVGEWIEASGIIRQEDGSNFMTVHSFHGVEEDSWDNEDDDDDGDW